MLAKASIVADCKILESYSDSHSSLPYPIACTGRNQHDGTRPATAGTVAERVRPVLLAVHRPVAPFQHRLVHHVLDRWVHLQRVDVVFDLLLGHERLRARRAAVDDVLNQLGLLRGPARGERDNEKNSWKN